MCSRRVVHQPWTHSRSSGSPASHLAMCGSSTAVPYASRVSRWRASRSKPVSSSTSSSSVSGVTALLPEELNHPVRDLDGGLPARNAHLSESFRVGDPPALHNPGFPVGPVHGGRASRVGIGVLADER